MINNPLKWFNLKKNKCPKCNADWAKFLVIRDNLLGCGKCDFAIGKSKYNEIVTSQVEVDINETYENKGGVEE